MGDPPGRFLKEDPASGRWYEIGDQAATRKASQALREKSSEFRACWREILAEATPQSRSRTLREGRGTRGKARSRRDRRTTDVVVQRHLRTDEIVRDNK